MSTPKNKKSHWTIIVGTLLLLVVGVTGCSKENIYHDKENGFRFSYPKDWHKSSPTPMLGVHVIVVGPPDDTNFTPSVSVGLPLRDDNILEMTKDDLQRKYEYFARNVEIRDFEIRDFAGRQAVYSHYRATVGEGIHVEGLQYIFIHGDHSLIVTATARRLNFEQNRPVFDAIFGSFQFD